MHSPQILTLDEVSNELNLLPDWIVEGNAIKASFEFDNFRTAFAFISMVAFEAEAQDHHPTWTNCYKRVDFSFSTHSVGNKITNLDIQMAKLISETWKKFAVAKGK